MQVIDHITPNQAGQKLFRPRHDMTAEVPREDSYEQIDRTGHYESPSRQKVQTAAPAILIEYFVCTIRCDGRSLTLKKSGGPFPAAVVIVSANRKFDQRTRQIVPHLTPIESWMDHKYEHAGESQRQKTHGDSPMGYLDPKCVVWQARSG